MTGLQPKRPYMLALAGNADGSGRLEPVATFTANPAGAAVVVAVGPLRRVAEATDGTPRRSLVIAPMVDGKPGAPLQIQG